LSGNGDEAETIWHQNGIMKVSLYHRRRPAASLSGAASGGITSVAKCQCIDGEAWHHHGGGGNREPEQ